MKVEIKIKQFVYTIIFNIVLLSSLIMSFFVNDTYWSGYFVGFFSSIFWCLMLGILKLSWGKSIVKIKEQTHEED